MVFSDMLPPSAILLFVLFTYLFCHLSPFIHFYLQKSLAILFSFVTAAHSFHLFIYLDYHVAAFMIALYDSFLQKIPIQHFLL